MPEILDRPSYLKRSQLLDWYVTGEEKRESWAEETPSPEEPAWQNGSYGDAPSRSDAPSMRRLLQELAELVAMEEGGDGYGARGVSKQAAVRAERFVRALPSHLPKPDIAAHPDGEVALEWTLGRRWVFSVAVGPGDILSYAGLFGKNKVSGREEFHGKVVPVAVLEQLRRLVRMAP